MLQKTYISLLFLLVLTACQSNTILGEWQLSSYSFNMDMDINGDGITSSNLLDEVSCVNNEILTINTDKTLHSINTFGPKVKVVRIDDKYMVSANCIQGSIGFSHGFTQDGDILHLDSGETYRIIDDALLTRTFKEFIKIYNENDEVVETKDLTLTYVKK